MTKSGANDAGRVRAADLLAELLWVETAVRWVEQLTAQHAYDLRNDFRTEMISVGSTYPFEVPLTVPDAVLSLGDDARADADVAAVRRGVEQMRVQSQSWSDSLESQLASSTERAFGATQREFAALHDAVVDAVSRYQAPPDDFADLADNFAVWSGETKEALAATYTRYADQRQHHVEVLWKVRHLISAAAGIDELGRVSLRQLSREVAEVAERQLALRQQHRAALVAEEHARLLSILAAGTSVLGAAAGGVVVGAATTAVASILDYTSAEVVPAESSEELKLLFVTAAEAADAWTDGVSRVLSNIDAQYEGIWREVDVQNLVVRRADAVGTWTPSRPLDDLTNGFAHLTGLV